MSFTYNGTSSDAHYLNITERHVYDAPVYDMQSVEVPGRSGDLLIPQNRFKNRTIVYRGYTKASDWHLYPGDTAWEEMSRGASDIKNWLLQYMGSYKDLSDTYDPGFFRDAYVMDVKITPIFDLPIGAEVEVTFMTKPFMKIIEDPLTVGSSGSVGVANNYPYDAYPKIIITPSAASFRFHAGSDLFTVDLPTAATVVCDSEAMEWYSLDAQGNPDQLVTRYVTSATPFPIIAADATTWIGPSYGITSMEIYRRLRTL